MDYFSKNRRQRPASERHDQAQCHGGAERRIEMQIGDLQPLHQRVVKKHGDQHTQQLDESERCREQAKIRGREEP